MWGCEIIVRDQEKLMLFVKSTVVGIFIQATAEIVVQLNTYSSIVRNYGLFMIWV
jgi:uncharacterized membrane protein YczE